MRTKRKSLIEERYYAMRKKQMTFITMVQERAAKLATSLVPYFPNDLMFKIFLLLPIKSLLRFTSVCKSWYKLIHCAEFVEAYNSQAKTTPIFLRKVDKERPNIFHVETQLNQLENFSLFPCNSSVSQRSPFFHFLEIEDGKGKITDLKISSSGSVLATCNGLILISSMYESYRKIGHKRVGRLIVMNPMTKKLIGLPLGTLCSSESYGLVFSHSEGVFKVVHLFKDSSGHVACEILSLQTRSWKGVDGPSFGLINGFSNRPVSALGALHWIPDDFDNDYIVSMDADEEQFSMTDLPKSLGGNDRLLEMGGFLSLVSCLDVNHLEVWILKGLEGSEWVKQHTISIDAVLGYVENDEFSVPAFALNAKEMVFRRRGRFYSYDFELEEIREIELEGGKIGSYDSIIPHVNNLATWEPLEPMS